MTACAARCDCYGDGVLVLLHCPKCSTGEAVRAAVFDDNFWPTLGLLALPLLLLAAAAAVLHRLGRAPRAPSRAPEMNP